MREVGVVAFQATFWHFMTGGNLCQKKLHVLLVTSLNPWHVLWVLGLSGDRPQHAYIYKIRFLSP